MPDLSQLLQTVSVWALPVLLAITLHEAAHGYVANHFGDDTARSQGRLSLNPLVHVDLFGTIIMPLFLLFAGGFIFGYAKPVPVNAGKLRNPRRDMIWVALAGPASNLVIAFAAALMLWLAYFVPGATQVWMIKTLQLCVFFNCLIALFNMLPIPPLDGGRVLTSLLPLPLARKLAGIEPVGLLVILGLFFLVPMFFGIFDLRVNPGEWLIFRPARWLETVIMSLVGFGP